MRAQEARAAATGWRALHSDMARSLGPQSAWAAQMQHSISGGAMAGGAASAAPDTARGAAARRRAAAAASAAATTSAEGSRTAWAVLTGRELPMEGLARQVLSLVGSSASYTQRRAADARQHGATAVESAWLVRADWPGR